MGFSRQFSAQIKLILFQLKDMPERTQLNEDAAKKKQVGDEFQPLAAGRMTDLVTEGLWSKSREKEIQSKEALGQLPQICRRAQVWTGKFNLFMHRKSFLAFRIRGLEALTEAEDFEWLFRNKIPGILCSQHFGNCQDEHPALFGCSAAPVPGKV